MTLARRAGIQVAETRAIRLKGEHALAVKRFDRKENLRIHCLSAATLLRSETPAGMTPEFGYPQLARALRRVGDPRTLATQLHELFRRMIFNILIANTDDHEKNHALLCHVNGRTTKIELSPAYDIVPTGSGALEHQFMISDISREPSLHEAMTAANDFDLTPLAAANAIISTISVVNDWQAHFRSLGVSTEDMQELAAFIDAPELVVQRQTFSIAPYATNGNPRRRASAGAKAFR